MNKKLHGIDQNWMRRRHGPSPHRSTKPVWLLLGLLLLACPLSAQDRHPVFVGSKVCAECHYGEGMGYQQCKWLLSAHASAHASLATPEAKRIAVLSGEPQPPQEAALCLGCHATGAQAEDWEKDPTFRMENGVQCEKCHGPGSEYMPLEVMTQPAAARRAGLKMPTKEDCMNCHKEKGSHVAVHGKPEIDINKAWEEIAHPTPKNWDYEPIESFREDPKDSSTTPCYTGAQACGQCHKGPEFGFQYSRWRKSPHARAYAVLATDEARKIAADMKVDEDPLTSQQCLKCHITVAEAPVERWMSTYATDEGVGCEACHGPGSVHQATAQAGHAYADIKKNLVKVDEQTCARCHNGAHGKPFDYQASLAKIAHPAELPPMASAPQYKNPLRLKLRPNSNELWVTCEASHTVKVIDTSTRKELAEISVGGHPTDVAFSPSGDRAYVSNRLDDSVCVVDAVRRHVLTVVPVGDEPHGLLTDPSGKTLYVLNTLADSISVIDTDSLSETKRLAASRNPWSMALSPDGQRIFITNTLSRFVPFRMPSISEITVLDTERAIVSDRIEVPGANLLQGITWHPSGRYALFVLNRTKNLVPMTRLLQGWTITNGLGIVWADGRVDQVLLDEPGRCFPDPTDVAITPDGRQALVTSSGLDLVAVVDLEKLIAMLESATPEERERVFPNHLGKPSEFIIAHIPVHHSPRGVLVAPDGRFAYVANCLDDSLSVIDVPSLKAVDRIDLGGPKTVTKTRWGERLFHSASITFRRQFSCHTCHPDGHVNGLTFDIEPDGIGAAPVDNRTLRGILDTAPFKWEGTNPSLQRQCGPRLSVFFTRLHPYNPKELAALDEYICTIPRPPNRYRPLGAELTDAQRRGKAVFERTRKADGSVIPVENRCVTCHFPPLYTDRRIHNVGTKMWLDEESEFDVPHLSNIYDSAPYLHNGIADTLEEIWTRYNPYDEHGVTNDMTKDQLNDLIEYLNTL